MKANDFISDVLDLLGEDVTYAPIWTPASILSYLRKTLRRFAEATLIVDGDSLRYVSTTTGEANVPSNFLNAHYVSYDKSQLDIVSLGELDFVTATWSLGTTGTSPLAATVMGTGRDATVRVVPVPTGAIGPFGWEVVTSVTLADSSDALWTVSVNTSGVLSTTSVLTGTTQTIILSGPTTFWSLSVDTSGVLSATTSATTTANTVVLADSSSMGWSVTADDSGVILTSGQYGKLTRMEINGVNQDFTSNYGTVSDAYAQGVASTPTAVVRLDGPYGIVTMGRVSDGALHVWYKGLIDDTPNVESEIYLNDCFIPIIQHGVLALAFNAEGSGRDVDKAKAFEVIFMLECDSVRRIFNRK
ncbi:MAG: hypothetical protein WC444_06445 [Candidatus Paceibacterota bacterium]